MKFKEGDKVILNPVLSQYEWIRSDIGAIGTVVAINDIYLYVYFENSIHPEASFGIHQYTWRGEEEHFIPALKSNQQLLFQFMNEEN